ncbi:MAG: methyltransferase domain-containing protein [Xanthomonadales bacterium]|nr:methyltransferase domain-containing protein [Xanthomonadales bacterium]
MPLHGELLKLKKFTRARTIRRYLDSAPEPALHIGCGGYNADGWLNVDKFHEAADTYLDAKRKFPFESDTFDLVFTEHMIEHLDIRYTKKFLGEIFRVLKAGGRCRITCPSLDKYAAAYAGGDDHFFDQVREAFEPKGRKMPEQAWLVKGNGGAFMTGIVKNFWGHRWMFDFENLEACLADIGFVEIRHRSCGESAHARLSAMDKPERAFETLYVEAVKPRG